MSSSSEHRGFSTQSLIKELCKHECFGMEPAVAARLAKSCLNIITSQDVSYLNSSLYDNDEFAVVERVKNHLKHTGREDSIKLFDALHRKLITLSTGLKNRSAILTLFLRLAESGGGSLTNGNVELSHTISQRSFDSLSLINSGVSLPNRRTRAGSDASKRCYGIGGPRIASSTMKQSSVEFNNTSNGSIKTEDTNWVTKRGERKEWQEPITRSICSISSPRNPRSTIKRELTELQIIEELLFCFQGIEGDVLKLDANNGFKINPLVTVPKPQMVKKLMELGYLHNYVQALCQELGEGGAVARGLACAIRDLLTDYSSRVAQLNSDLKQSLSIAVDSPMSEEGLHCLSLTLLRLVAWVREPMWQLQILADICRECVRQRGGAVISAAYTFSHHGDPTTVAVSTKILTAATRPLFTLMCHWIIEGELYDPHDEFFVAVNKMCPSINRWKDKYYLRKDLVPAVMSEKQAMMVLSTGNCISFLNEICKNKMAVTGARAKLRHLENANGGELLQLAEPGSPLATIIESAFLEASQLVLETLKDQFKLYENFQALRRYMLMGQGDFYRYLMQLMEPELNKNVDHLNRHNLISILETAIRSTNAQFEDREILERVSVTMLEPSAGECGWDVFNMVYCLDKPLETVFQMSDTYQTMFLFLWQLKRVEYTLSNFRKEQTYLLKKIQSRTDFDELKALLKHMSVVTAEMVHYINQVQYYILFEVIECAFENLVRKFAAATTIEEVIRDHELFLAEIKAKTLKDNSIKSRSLSSLIAALNLSILTLMGFSNTFLVAAEAEVNRRLQWERLVEEAGTNNALEAKNKERVLTFMKTVKTSGKEVNSICQSYKDYMRQLLVQLSSQQDDLQLLSTRLDFNEFYKRTEPELSENIKFRRVSNFLGNSLTVRE